MTNNTLCVMQLFGYSLAQFSEQLATAGIATSAAVRSVTPVDGYTLEAQMRALNDLPTLDANMEALAAGSPFVLPPPPASTARCALTGTAMPHS